MLPKGTRVFVTGAGGFIGSHLVEQLVIAGCSVTALLHYDSRPDRSNLELVPEELLSRVTVLSGNIEDASFLHRALAGTDVVFHLAALIGIPHSYVAPSSYVRTNVEGTLHLLEAARAQRVGRVVLMSSSEVYGSAQYVPIDEAHPLQAQSPYSATKIAAEKLAESYWRSFELPVVTVRAFNNYGPRQSARAVIPTIVSQQLFAPKIRVGSVSPSRDFLFVKDSAAGLAALAACDAAVGRVLNLGTGRDTTVEQIIRAVQQITGLDKPIVVEADRVRPERSEVQRLLCDASTARALTGWAPSFGLEQGLEETIAFVRSHPDRFPVDSYAR